MKMVKAILLASFALLAACDKPSHSPAGSTAKTATDSATTIYFGGDILTMEGDVPAYAEAVTVKGGRISFVGAKSGAMQQQGQAPRSSTCRAGR